MNRHDLARPFRLICGYLPAVMVFGMAVSLPTASSAQTLPSIGETLGVPSAAGFGFSVRPTSDSGYILAGSSVNTSGVETPAVFKLSSTGQVTWQNSYSFPGTTHISVIQQTVDSGYIMAGLTTSNLITSAVVVKLDSSGNVSWQRAYGSGLVSNYAAWIQQTLDGGYIFAGSNLGAWAVKLDSGGNIVWQKSYGPSTPGTSAFGAIQQTSDNGYVATGFLGIGTGNTSPWVVKMDSSGAVTWQQIYSDSYSGSASSIEQTTDGGYVVGGSETVRQANTLKFRAVAMKIDSAGNVTWRNYYSQAGSVTLPPGLTGMIRQSTSGNYGLLIPRSLALGAIHAIVAQVDQNGGITNQAEFGLAPGADASWIEPTSDGGFAVAGTSFLVAAPYSQGLVLKLDGSLHSGACGRYKGPSSISAAAEPAQLSSPTLLVSNTSATASQPSVTATASSFTATNVCN